MKFKFGTSSYIYPADICENIEKLAKFDMIKSIQFLLFESEDYAGLPNPIDENKILFLKKKYNLNFAVHLPLNINLSEKLPVKTLDSLSLCVETGKKIGAEVFALHIDAPLSLKQEFFYSEFPENILNDFNYNASKNLEYLLKKTNIQNKLAIENLNYNPGYLKFFVDRFDIGICADFGHIFLYNLAIESFSEYAGKIRLVHIHDVDSKNKDHSALNNKKRISEVLNFLVKRNYSGNVIIELFELRKFLESIEFLKINFSERIMG
ncbi:MAG TPA: cobamide remodeling phosphodiesterase CbiR [bacterium]|nr:cobamide remodeling phosphodiesterase CbiR [bacterium]HPN31549.1 cobamide remodeling phosphodiesterase CbiR [bacterium]